MGFSSNTNALFYKAVKLSLELALHCVAYIKKKRELSRSTTTNNVNDDDNEEEGIINAWTSTNRLRIAQQKRRSWTSSYSSGGRCWWWTSLAAIVISSTAASSVPVSSATDRQFCLDDESCRARFGRRSDCDKLTNFCTLPYERGCLDAHERIGGKLRVCNSDDPPEAQRDGLCRKPNIDHDEIRIFSYDWDSSLFQAWVLQIIFSELLDVPTSIETGWREIVWNFYRGDGSRRTTPEFSYGASVAVGSARALENAFVYKDCRLSSKRPEKYESCAHIAPEIWWDFAVFGANREHLDNLERRDIIDPPSTLGALGQSSLFIPKFTAENDPSLLNYFGYMGADNRRKLAETFKRPTSWIDYCQMFSTTNCTEPDTVAQRPPTTSDEDEMFFREGLYTGHFRKTAKNDCDQYPMNCTGHVNDLPCGLYSPVVSQIYHLDIALEPNAYGGALGYKRTRLAEIWRAANATKSNVAM